MGRPKGVKRPSEVCPVQLMEKASKQVSFFSKSRVISWNISQVKSNVTNYVAHGKDLCFIPAAGFSKRCHGQSSQLLSYGSGALNSTHCLDSIPETRGKEISQGSLQLKPSHMGKTEAFVKAPTWIVSRRAASARWASGHRWSGPAPPSPQSSAAALAGRCDWPQLSRPTPPDQSGNCGQSSTTPSTVTWHLWVVRVSRGGK